jgi:hypothetical protein
VVRLYFCRMDAHSGDRLDCRVKVELKVLYIGTGGRGVATHPLLVQIGKVYVACSRQSCACDNFPQAFLGHWLVVSVVRRRRYITVLIPEIQSTLVGMHPCEGLGAFLVRMPRFVAIL